MDYKDLPQDEKMAHAEQYALVLKDEIKLQEQIVDELSSIFYLTKKDALQAYVNSKQKYKTEYSSSNKRKISQMLVTLVVSTTVAVIYLGISAEKGFGFVFIIAIIFILSAIGIFNFSGSIIFDNVNIKYPWANLIKKNFFIGIFPSVAFMFLFLGYNAIWGEMLVNKDMETRTYKLNEDVIYKSTGGKSPTHYYYFRFNGFDKDFRLWQSEYKYADRNYLKELKKGDSVTISFLKDDISTLRTTTFFNKTNRITNIFKDS